MTTAQIEQQFQFEYPALYKQLAQDGMLEVGEYGPDWMTTVLPKLRENPTLFLFSNDTELLSLELAHERIADLADPNDYRAIKPEYQFIPFAQNGAADYYCFLPTAQQNAEVPVVFLWHDTNEATFLAKNLQDFIFRRLLTDMSDQDIFNQVSDEEFKHNLTRMLKTHAPYLTEIQRNILGAVLNRPCLDYSVVTGGYMNNYRGLLTANELHATIAATIPFVQLDVSFPYSAE